MMTYSGMKCRGSAMLIVLLSIAVLAAVASGVLAVVSDRHRSAFESGSWNESILAAEAGADIALNTLNKALLERTKWSNRSNALTSTGAAWTTNWGVPITATGATSGSFAASTGSNTTSGTITGRWFRPTTPLMVHNGEGSRRLFANIIIDAPASLKVAPRTQWYRIRSTGMAELPFRRAGSTAEDNALRQVSLVWDQRGVFVPPPFAGRLIEVVVQPISGFSAGLITDQDVRVPGPAGVVDSFDPRDPLKSTDGLYDPAKRQENGNVATNGTVFEVGGTIYGDAATNGGNLQPSSKITGEVRNDFYKELTPVTAPTWSPTPSTPTNVTLSSAVVAGPSGTTKVKLATWTGTLTLSPNPGTGSGEVEIWVTGDIAGPIVVQPGVTARVYFAGNINVKGSDIVNQTNRAANLQYYGINPSGGQSRSILIDSPGNFTCAIYAPGHDMEVHGNPDMIGAFVTKSLYMNGNCGVHYDESLIDDDGLILSFKVANWLEDVR
jgi:hypothetical protein